jgi:cyanophycinase
MGSHVRHTIPGPVALVGSGEYLDIMNDTDRYLLEVLGGLGEVTVALLPTASGLESNGPTYWNDLGLHHFQQLGVQDIRATHIIDRAGAHDPEQLKLLRDVDFYYFSGGNPLHIIETLRDTPAWQIIKDAYEAGAVLAGCSAGAMMLSGRTISIRQAMLDGKIDLVESLGIVPELIVLPHFDRMSNFLDQQRFKRLLQSVPSDYTVVGVDEDTALVRISANAYKQTDSLWRVMGRQTVKIFARDAEPRTLQPGEEIRL